MSQFLDQAFTMPTAVFSVLLILVGFYWAISLIAGMDLFGGFFEGAEGALEGSLDGAADGALDADLDGGGHGHGWMRLLGVGEVPATLVISLIVGFGWVFSFGGSVLASNLVSSGASESASKWASTIAFLAAGSIGAILLITVTAIGMSLVATMVAVTPLRKMMRFAPATERSQLVGRTALVTTQRVDAHFGQAEVQGLEGAPILIQARAALPNDIRRGSQVRIDGYDPAAEVFEVRETLLIRTDRE